MHSFRLHLWLGLLMTTLASPPTFAVILDPPVAACAAQTCASNHAFSRQLLNLTGQPVDGVVIAVEGLDHVDQVYTGPENPFGEPSFKGLGPDGVYRLRFTGATVLPGQSVRIAFCGDGPRRQLVPLGEDPALYWLIDDEPVIVAPIPALGHELRPASQGGGLFAVSLELSQWEPRSLTFGTLEWALSDTFFPIEQLDGQGLSGQVAWQPLTPESTDVPIPEAEAAPATIDLPLPGTFTYDDPRTIVFRFSVYDPEAPENVFESYAQMTIATLLTPVFLEERAIETVAADAGIPASQLKVLSRTTAHYQLLEAFSDPFRLVGDGVTVYDVELDGAGNPVDGEALESQEQALYKALYGKLEPELADQLGTASADELIEVAIWLEESTGVIAKASPPQRPDPQSAVTQEDVDNLLAVVDSYRSARAQAVIAPFLAQLSSLTSTAEPQDMVPVVYAKLLPAQIYQVADWPAVDTIYRTVTYEPDLDIVGPTVRADLVHTTGLVANGVRLGVIEVGGVVAPANPFLAGLTQNGANACLSSHSTAVAGVVGSTHVPQTGMAPGSVLFAAGSCLGFSGQLMQASNWARAQGARALNLSWGDARGTAPGALDRFYDDMVINGWRTVVKSAGNEAGCCRSRTGRISSPGRAYNVITVGNFDDRNTREWQDDRMQSCSSFVDPSSRNGDREKPEVAAPGTNIRSTTLGPPWTGGSNTGTSFAAPVVTGGAGLLFERDPALAVWPEATKAIFMATATHNIEGATRLSDRDGAGGVVLDQAVATAFDGQQQRWNGRAYDCTAPQDLDVETLSLAEGRLTRVAMAWSQPPDYGAYATRPSADLDLHIIAPDDSLVAWSTSWDNTSEIVEFTPNVSGDYRLRVHQWRCSQSPEWLGWAWWQDPQIIVPGVGWGAQGAGIEIADCDNNGQSDMLLMAYDSPHGPNEFRYKIGWNLDQHGQTSFWSGYHPVAGVGWEGQGAGVSVTDLDGNGALEMILMGYDNPPGANTFRYRIGWNMVNCTTSDWGPVQIVNGVGWEGQGAGTELVDLDGNGRPEIVLMGYDNPPQANNFRYRIGWNLDAGGQVGSWTGYHEIGGVGWRGQGAGVTFADLDNSGRPEMILMGYDNPPTSNTFRYRIGWNVDTSGVAGSWDSQIWTAGVGWEADGADPKLFDIDGDGIEELFLMAYDDPPRGNTFRYRVIHP